MRNKSFFYQQYNKINWENQEKTKINASVYDFIIESIIPELASKDISIFDIGFGVGFFIKKLYENLINKYSSLIIEGCEPSDKNYEYFIKNKPLIRESDRLNVFNRTFQDLQTDKKFDFVTSTYVFLHFASDDLDKAAQKIHSMLKDKGKFVLVVADEKYIEEKLKDKRDLFIERNIIEIDSKKYREVLHYSDLPQIGKVIDYTREESFYVDLFKRNNFELAQRETLSDSGFICTIFVFEKKA